MNIKPLSLMVALSITGTTVSAAPWINIDARNGGMGGLSVVTSNKDAAPFSNPAILATGEDEGAFSMMFSAGGTYADPNDFTGALSAFNTAFAAIPASPVDPLFLPAVNTANTALGNLGGKGYLFDLGGGLASGFKLGQWAAAFSASFTSANDFGVGSNDTLPPAISLTDGSTNAQLQALSINTQDIGLSLARSFELSDDLDLAVGITPKLQTITIGEGAQALNLTDPSNITGLTINLDSGQAGFNTDLGVVGTYAENIKFGVSARNMLAQTFTTTAGTTVTIQPQMRAGAAYVTDLFTVGVDLDLTENTAYVSGAKSKYMILGTEFNAWNIMQLRLGYRSNTLDSNDLQYSLGMGLFTGINLGVMTNPNNQAAGVSGYFSFNLNL